MKILHYFILCFINFDEVNGFIHFKHSFFRTRIENNFLSSFIDEFIFFRKRNDTKMENEEQPSIRETLNLILSEVSSLKKSVSSLETSVAAQDAWRTEKEPLFRKIGLSLEFGARAYLRDIKGADFVKPLRVDSLSCLASTCLPPDKPFDSEILSSGYANEHKLKLIELRVAKLISYAANHIDGLENWTCSALTSNDRKLADKAKKVRNSLDKYHLSSEKQDILRYDTLGF